MGTPGTPAAREASNSSVRRAGPERAFIGKRFLNKYDVCAFLGEGSNAHVMLARPTSNPEAFVVVKRIKDHVVNNPRFKQFFDAEVRSMGKFTHPYAIKLLDASLDDPNGPCMVFDFIRGVTLESILDQQGKFTIERAGRILGPLCHALHSAHKGGIVHRDLKPANLMIVNPNTEYESVRVLDFGFAGFTAEPHIQLAELTGKGDIYACGTPAYISPEMIRGDTVDGRGDLYSVGVILYEMLTGRLPFDAENQQEIMMAHLRNAPKKFSTVDAAYIPAAIETVVNIALSKFPNERHQTAKEMAEHYGRVLGVDLWAMSAPVGFSEAEEEIVECTLAAEPEKPAGPEDPYILSDRFEAMMPERLAALKLRGFIEEVGGVAVSSEPGLIKVRLDLPSGWKEPSEKGSALFSWIRTRGVSRGKEPIEVDLKMSKLDANRVAVTVIFRPLKWYLPDDKKLWNDRCEYVYTTLRRFLMAE